MKTLLADTSARHSVIVWAALVAFTLISFALGGEHVVDAKTLAAVIVIGIGAIKIRLVGLHFMELRGAPLPLRAVFEGYCVLLFCVLMGIYVFA
jgi:caa(3)-type oxidase subunit IV